MQKFLQDKKILFIGYVYFDYHIKIHKAMIDAGAEVFYYPVMNYNIMYTIYRRISRKLFLRHNKKHGDKILRETKSGKFDYVFVLQGYQLPDDFFKTLRAQNPDALFVNYYWDAVRVTEFGNTLLDVIPYFDIAFSFDKSDCEKYKELNYLPLFYTDKIDKHKEKKIYDLAFVGTVTVFRRYEYVKTIEAICEKLNLTFKYYIYITYKDYIRFFFKGKIMKKVNFRPISFSSIQELYNSAKAVIDLPNQVQSGLTMRVIEVLADGMKLITSNDNIKREPFYNKKNIYIIDLNNIDLDINFLISNAEPLDMSKYHINNWLKTLFMIS